MIVVVGNVKGGVGKTTTAVFVAAGLTHHGRVVLVDADPRSSAVDWAAAAGSEGLGFPVVRHATADLGRRVQQLADGADHVVIDTPPELEGVIRSALHVADLLLVPLGTTPMEVRRLRATLDIVADVAGQGRDFAWLALFTRVRRTTSARLAREMFAEREIPLMTAEIPLAERFALAYGQRPTSLYEYGAVVDELLKEDT